MGFPVTFIKRPFTWSPTVCRIHCYGADRVFPNVLLDFYNQNLSIGAGYLHCVVDAGKRYLFFLAIIEMNVHDRTDNL